MTRRARKVCSRPGCPFLAVVGESKCEKCERESDRSRGTAAERGYDARWRAFRDDYLLHNPFCEDPSGCARLATDLDHLDGLGPLGPRGFDPSNCRGLCHSHHSAKTARENGSFGRWAS